MKTNLQENKNLVKRLSGYAASAGALVAIGSTANAQVAYSGPQNLELYMPDGYLAIDIDGDLINDFAIEMYGYMNSGTTYGFPYVFRNGYAVIENLKTDTYKNSWLTVLSTIYSSTSGGTVTYQYKAPIAQGLDEGMLIDPAKTNWANASYPNISGALGAGYIYSIFTPSSTIVYGLSVGNFLGVEGKYVGIRFHIGTDQHYGWIRLSATAELDTVTVMDWAYQQTPELQIQAGEGLVADLAPTMQVIKAPLVGASRAITLIATEEITGFTVDDIVITNGTLSDFTEVTAGAEYTFNVTADAEGEVKLEIPAGSFSDLAANDNIDIMAAWLYDLSAPMVSMQIEGSAHYTNNLVRTVHIYFDEPVTGFTSDDLELTNCSVGSVRVESQGTHYTVDVIAISEGTVGVVVPVGVVADESGNLNEYPYGVEWVYDATPPTIEITSDIIGGTTLAKTVDITVVFSEPVMGLSLVDFVLSNATANNLTEVEETVYRLEVSAIAAGPVSVELNFGAASDIAENLTPPAAYEWNYEPNVGIDEMLAEGVSIYPNPAQAILNIELAKESSIQIFDLNGQTVFQDIKVLKRSLDVSSFAPGIYIVQVVTDNKAIRQRIVIE